MPHHVAIVIPALNEERHIRACLTSVMGLDPSGPTFEVVLADNGSTDHTRDIARELGARVVTNTTVTIGGLRNDGARHAGGTVVAFLDADCTVSSSWLTRAISAMEKSGAHIVGSAHRAPDGAGWVAAASTELSAGKTGAVTYVPSGNMIVTRECFDAVGGFDERMTTTEDVDLCRRARDVGYGVFADPEIIAVHHGVPRSALDLFRREVWHGRDSFRVFFDDLKRVTNLSVVLYSLAFALVGCLGIIAIVISALTLNVVPLAAEGILLLGLAATVWVLRVRSHRTHRFSILLHQLVYGTARATSLCGALAGLFGRREHSSGSWRVTGRHQSSGPSRRQQ